MENAELYEQFKDLDQDRLSYTFRDACYHGDLETIKYLTLSPDLTEHADIHDNNDLGFELVCNNKHLEVIQFLIFDLNIEKNKQISKYLKNFPNEQAENMFKIRELNQKLKSELISDKINNNKMKV